MAKITTKKGTGALEPKKEALATPVLEPKTPNISPKATSEDTRIAPVKVTRPAFSKAPTVAQSPKPPAAPHLEKRPRSSGSLLIGLGGMFLVLLALLKLSPSATENSIPDGYLPQDPTAREMLTRDDRQKLALSNWKNEEPSFIGKFFKKLCLGYATSDGCSGKPLHPFMQVAEELGIQLEFDKEKDTKVIEQTIEYKSRAFTLGK